MRIVTYFNVCMMSVSKKEFSSQVELVILYPSIVIYGKLFRPVPSRM